MVAVGVDLGEEPRGDERAAGEHERGEGGGGAQVRAVVGVRVDVAVADKVDVAAGAAGPGGVDDARVVGVGEVVFVGPGGGVDVKVDAGVEVGEEGGAGGDVVPVGGAGVPLLAAAPVEGHGGDDARGVELVEKLFGGRGGVFCACADFTCDGGLAGDVRHAVQHFEELSVLVEERGAGAGAVDEVDWAAAVEVDEGEGGGGDQGGDGFGGFDCLPGFRGADLRAEGGGFGGVGAEEGPFGLLALEEREGHGHFGVGAACAEAGAEAAEGEVAGGGERGEDGFVGGDVEGGFLVDGEAGFDVGGVVFGFGVGGGGGDFVFLGVEPREVGRADGVGEFVFAEDDFLTHGHLVEDLGGAFFDGLGFDAFPGGFELGNVLLLSLLVYHELNLPVLEGPHVGL